MKFLEYHRRENKIVKIYKKATATWFSTVKLINKPIFELKGRKVLLQDALIIFIVVIVISLSLREIYSPKKVSSASVQKQIKVVEAPAVPKESWDYIRFFEANDSFLTMNKKTQDSPNFAQPYVKASKDQKDVINKIRDSLNLPTLTLNTVSNTLEENTDTVIDPTTIDTTGNETTNENLATNQKSQVEAKGTEPLPSQIVAEEEKKANLVNLTCGPFLVENDAKKYVGFLKNSPRNKFKQSEAKVTNDNNNLYWLNIKGDFNDNDISWIQRYYNFNCQ
ncbi:hypothetical protein [Psittacicella gerlachiana]|uniref:SPOR domain-containing protein n=1 Tax=Psittacicella gerlachiana TaxID=2028574 RepID=A0A3A1Y6E5_9GAMM|nr:hypothetical protein [Psittacicella gerlachiana]RIY31624.1 hypothetical protein CKF59_07525 [Psittacicella gerlachiana]